MSDPNSQASNEALHRELQRIRQLQEEQRDRDLERMREENLRGRREASRPVTFEEQQAAYRRAGIPDS